MRKNVAIVVLVVALAGVGASVAWAVSGPRSAWAPGSGMGYGMMSGHWSAPDASPVSSLPAAKARAQAFAATLGLHASEVLQFERNFYVKLVDAKGTGATEVLVDPATGYVSLEYGPAMMWNTKYGMMSGQAAESMMGRGGMMGGGMMGSFTAPGHGGMMGGSYGAGSGPMGAVAPSQTPTGSVSIADARLLAQQWLDAKQPGVKVETGGDAFPGTYTLETLRDGKIVGMISVNGTTGAIWPHWWHGAFVTMAA